MRIQVAGACMHPTLSPGDWVWVRASGEPKPGDVVLLEASGCREIHRLLVRIRAGNQVWFVHAGDASDQGGVVRADEILGVVEVRGRRPRPAAGAHLLGLGLRLGGLLRWMGMHPGLPTTPQWMAGVWRRAASGVGTLFFLLCGAVNPGTMTVS